MSTLLKITAPIQERIVQVSDGEGFAVRGLNPLNVVALYRRHMGELEPMFQQVMASAQARGTVDASDIQPLLLGLVSESPLLMGELIVIASGGDPANVDPVTIADPEGGDAVTLPAFDAALTIAMALPFTVQVDALSKVGELTFTQDMPPGKFLALVATLLRSVSRAVQGMTASLQRAQNGSGESGGPSIS